MTKRRVVVTGVGVVTPLGNDIETTWANIKAGKSGVGPLTRLNPDDFPAKIAAEVKDFVIEDFIEKRMRVAWTALRIMRWQLQLWQ